MTHRRGGAGFTLLEMAIVLVIIGVLASVFMGFMERFSNREKLEEGRRDAEYAAAEVEGYLLGNKGKLPDPASGNLLPPEIGNTKDPWGRDYRYWRADELDATSVDDVDSTDMYIRFFPDAANLAALTNPTRTIRDVAYVVLSTGKDGVQSFTQTPGSIYINMLKEGAPTSDGGSFDDILQYKTLPQLRTTYAASGRAPDDPVPAPRGGSDPAVSISGGVVGGSGLSDVLGNPSYVAPGANVGAVSIDGGSGQALGLGGGVEDYIDLTQNTNDYAFGTFTIMSWFKTGDDYDANATNAFGVITSRQNNTSVRNWWLTIWGGGFNGQSRTGLPRGTLPGDLAFKAGNGYIVYTHAIPQVNYDDKRWHFVALSLRKTDTGYAAELYVDGEVKDAQTASSAPPHGTGYELYIGSGTYNDNRRFEGLLDSFYLFGSTNDAVDGSLNATQVDAYYQAVKADYGY